MCSHEDQGPGPHIQQNMPKKVVGHWENQSWAPPALSLAGHPVGWALILFIEQSLEKHRDLLLVNRIRTEMRCSFRLSWFLIGVFPELLSAQFGGCLLLHWDSEGVRDSGSTHPQEMREGPGPWWEALGEGSEAGMLCKAAGVFRVLGVQGSHEG